MRSSIVTYIPGLKAPSGFGTSTSVSSVRVPGANAWAKRVTLPGNAQTTRRTRTEELEDGLLLLAEASDHGGDFWLAPELPRLKGEFLLHAGRGHGVEEYLAQALNAAREQSARLLELRAAMSLARLWRDQGKVQQARELLAPVYEW